MNPLNQKMTMKTRKLLWAALSMTAALMMTACSSDDNDTTEAPVAPSTETATKTIPYTVTVGGDEATTRATVDGNNKTLYFAEGDKLYITGADIKGVLDLKAGDEGKTTGATFSGELTYSGSGSPADGLSLTATLVSAQQTVGTQVSVDDAGAVTVNYPTTAYCSTIGDAVQQYSWLTGTSTYGDKAFTLAQQTAFLNFEITFEDGTATGETLSAAVSNGGAAVCTANVTTATESEKVVAKFVLPVAAGTTLSSATVTMGGKAAINFGASQTLTGKVYNVKKTQAATVLAWDGDLSMVDCAGNVRTSRWTANCYMVHTAGDYYLPLVYGNAIKNGETNAAAYTGVTNSNTTLTFPRHDGEAITAPWIKDNSIAVNSAELLWQDAQGLVTAVGISEDGDYLTLTVGKDAAEQEGNAVIAAKDAEGTIVWSWHIWVTKQTFATLTEVNTGSHTYQLTPVNLGWVGDATSAIGGYNTYYQWGRKDAFIPSNPIPSTGTDNTNHTVYGINNNDVTTTAFSHTNDNSMTIGGNIQHPTVHYRNTSTFGPCNTRYYNMWDAQQTSDAENTAAATVKTVYDPCPPGFCVPTSGLYYYFTIQTVPEFNKDITYSGVFFPASGCRSSGYGTINGVGSDGYCWSATPGGATHGRYFYFGSGSWYLNGSNRTYGYPVRAVAE
jgi:hypothetical protein